MKQVDTEPGSQYSVDSAAGCTVSTPAGQVICRVMPGILGSFMASGYVTCFSDDAAGVTLVASGTPGGTGGQPMQISQALDAANRAEAAREKAVAAAGDAEAAQVKAEQEADNAEAAAESAQASESIAAQAARPATMYMLADGLGRLLGNPAAVAIDTDGQAIIVHTDRLEGDILEQAEDLISRYVPAFIEVERYNHHIEVSWRDINKYAACKNDADLLSANPDYANDLTSNGEWVYPMPLFDAAYRTFQNCGIARFDGDLKSLTNGTAMLAENQLTSWNIELPSLTNGQSMFRDNQLTSWNIELRSLTNGTAMFQNNQLTSWNIELPSLTGGTSMFQNNKLTSWNIELRSLTSGNSMFRDNQLTSWNIELPSLTGGTAMFQNNQLTSWNIELPSLTGGNSMFQRNQLTSWNTELRSLTDGNHMFRYNQLTSWNIELPGLTDGTAMFADNKLTSWNIELPSLTNGNAMFADNQLTSWNIELPNLTNGRRMFDKSAFDKASALIILDSIPNCTSGTELLLGIHVDHQSDDDVLAAIANAEAKGWTMTVQWNGTATAQAATTYGLRKPPIYAKVGEMENGERYLDWGHYVTDSSGYEEFRSVAAAREFYGLPEEDLT